MYEFNNQMACDLQLSYASSVISARDAAATHTSCQQIHNTSANSQLVVDLVFHPLNRKPSVNLQDQIKY